MDIHTRTIIEDLFLKFRGDKLLAVFPMPASGSRRKYYRVQGERINLIFSFNPDIKENETFFYLHDHFRKYNLKIPEIIGISDDRQSYLQQDLGDTTLFSLLTRRFDMDSALIRFLLSDVIGQLVRFQFEAGAKTNFNKCYPEPEFDRLSMMADLNYFRYCFLLPTGEVFNSRKIDSELAGLVDYIYEPENHYFMYRDFQSRNIMIHENVPWFIDFQGGRKGHYLYDLASFLFQAKAGLSNEMRNELFGIYVEKASAFKRINAEDARKKLDGYAVLRLLQALGAYGYRGFFERKDHFLSSVPFALDTLSEILDSGNIKTDLCELKRVVDALKSGEFALKKNSQANEKLTVSINSFSYKSRIPFDLSGNGGGFVFDCRALPNPGRYEEYAVFTGLEKPIKDFLKDRNEIKEFKAHVFEMVSASIDNYMIRNFSNLTVNFGCTGGKHRSVYMAESLKNYLAGKYDIHIRVTHTELDKLKITAG